MTPDTRLPEGWEVHTREEAEPPAHPAPPDEPPIPPAVEVLGLLESRWDLTPTPPRIGPDNRNVIEYAESARELSVFEHRDGGSIYTSVEDAIWILNHLGAAGFRLVRVDQPPSNPALREALEVFEVVDLPPAADLPEGLLDICAHEIAESPTADRVHFSAWQLQVRRRSFGTIGDPNELIYKGRNMMRDSRPLRGFILIANGN